MRFHAPTWQGARQALPLTYAAANADMQAGMGLKYALWESQQQQRNRINAMLRDRAKKREAEKAAKSNNGWLGLGGAGAGAALGALLAIPTGGLSVLAGAGLGGAIGGTTGGAIDQAMGNDGSGGMQLGNTLMDFSTEFLPTKPNPYYQAAQQVGVNGYPIGQEMGPSPWGGS